MPALRLRMDWRPSWLQANAVVLVAYFVAAYVGDVSGLVLFGNLTLFWPPSGIALASLLFLGYRVAPAVWLGSLLGNIVVFRHPDALALSIGVNAIVGLGSALQAVVGAYLIQRACKGRDPLDAPADVLKFIGLGGVASATISASLATPALTLAGFSSWDNFLPFAWTWWLGDATGIVVVTPLLLVFLGKPRLRVPSYGEALAWLVGFVLVGHLVFGILGGAPRHYSLAHAFLPFLVWSTLRFGPHGAVTSIFLTYMMAMVATPLGHGPFADQSHELSVLLLQAFVGTLTVTTLVLSAIFVQRQRAQASLQRAHDELELRVEERTRALRDSNRRLEEERNFSSAVFDLAGALLVVLDREGRVVQFNRASEQLTGLDRAEVAGTRFSESCVSPSGAASFERALRDIRAGTHTGSVESPWRTQGGHERIVEWTAAPLGDEFVIISGTDVTARKEMDVAKQRLLEQEQLARREAESAIQQRDDFVAIASHELRTPLTPLRLVLDVLDKHLRAPAAAELPNRASLLQALERGAQQAGHLAELIEHLLDVSRIRAGRMVLALEDVDVAALVSSVVDRLRPQLQTSKCTVVINAAPGVKGTWDRSRIDQVITNLMTNAMKYGAGKPIEIEISATDGLARLAIRDHGIGITKEQQEKLFQRFERAAPLKHFRGIGLGLYITHEIVAAHGGTISVESEPGHGALFTVELPFRVEERAVLPPPQPSSGTSVEAPAPA